MKQVLRSFMLALIILSISVHAAVPVREELTPQQQRLTNAVLDIWESLPDGKRPVVGSRRAILTTMVFVTENPDGTFVIRKTTKVWGSPKTQVDTWTVTPDGELVR